MYSPKVIQFDWEKINPFRYLKLIIIYTTSLSPKSLFYLQLIFLIREISCGKHEDRLIHHIFNHRNHNAYARPVKNESEALEVRFGIDIQQIIDVDEKNEMFHTNMWLKYEWLDWNLSWNMSEYNDVSTIRLPSGTIWTPDILLYNSVDEDIDSKFPTNVVVDNTGLCTWIPLGLFISSCYIDIKWFPFDDQFCKMKFGSWTYDGSQINFVKSNESIVTKTYSPSGEWDLLQITANRSENIYECCVETFIDITYTFHLRRRTLYYGFNLIIPCALVSILALLTFILPPDAGEKIGLGITILLSLSVFQTIVANMVPPTSMAVPLVGIYFACVMIMSTISVIMTVFVLHLHHNSPDICKMPNCIKTSICEWLAWSLRMSRPQKDLTLKKLTNRASVRELEEKLPPSLSLLSNVEDGDSSIPICKQYFRFKQEDDGIMCIRNEILSILNEIRFITRKIKNDARSAEITNDWKFAAMVIDRLCFLVFSAYLVIITFGIFFSAPHIFG